MKEITPIFYWSWLFLTKHDQWCRVSKYLIKSLRINHEFRDINVKNSVIET